MVCCNNILIPINIKTTPPKTSALNLTSTKTNNNVFQKKEHKGKLLAQVVQA